MISRLNRAQVWLVIEVRVLSANCFLLGQMYAKPTKAPELREFVLVIHTRTRRRQLAQSLTSPVFSEMFTRCQCRHCHSQQQY